MVDLPAAQQFLFANARLLERHRFAVLTQAGPPEPALLALRAYRNGDGGYGHALEPDVRSPHSEPVATLAALDVLLELGATRDPSLADTAAWIGRIADPDGAVPFVLPSAANYPRGPWMVAEPGGSHLTFGLAAALWSVGSTDPWLARATDWCWAKLGRPSELSAYWLKFALDFLDAVPDEQRAVAVLETLRPSIGADGCVSVPGGTEDERLTPLDLSTAPDGRSRALFTAAQLDADLDRLAGEQRADGGWMFDWLAWSPAQSVEWRGLVTLQALRILHRNGRLTFPTPVGSQPSG